MATIASLSIAMTHVIATTSEGCGEIEWCGRSALEIANHQNQNELQSCSAAEKPQACDCIPEPISCHGRLAERDRPNEKEISHGRLALLRQGGRLVSAQSCLHSHNRSPC